MLMTEILQSIFYRSFFFHRPHRRHPPLTLANMKAVGVVHDHKFVPCKSLRCTLGKLQLDSDGQISCGLIQAFTFLVSGSIDYLSPNCFSISDLIYLMTRPSLYGSHLNTQYPLYTTFPAVCSRLLESVTVPFENGV